MCKRTNDWKWYIKQYVCILFSLSGWILLKRKTYVPYEEQKQGINGWTMPLSETGDWN